MLPGDLNHCWRLLTTPFDLAVIRNTAGCLWHGHQLFVAEPLSSAADRIRCNRCDRQWAMNHDLRILLPWDDEIEEMYHSIRKSVLGEPSREGK